MSISFLRTLLVIAIFLLVVTQVVGWISQAINSVAGVFSGIAIMLVYMYCTIKARAVVSATAKSLLWLLVPTLVFTIVPTVIKLYQFLSQEDKSVWVKLWDSAPILLSFFIPVGLLVWVYYGLAAYEKEQIQ